MHSIICHKLKTLRASHGLTQAEVAHALNVSREAYSLYENGKRQMNYETLCAAADYYHISLDYLLGRSSSAQNYELNENELRLLEIYRSCDLRGRSTLLEIAKINARYSTLEPHAQK